MNETTDTAVVKITYEEPKVGQQTGTDVNLEDIFGNFTQVTAITTYVPQKFIDGIALDTTTGKLYYYDFTNNVWRATLSAPRVSSVTSGASITTNTDSYDAVSITALAVGTTIDFSGTPSNFQKMIVRVLDNGGSRTIAWGASLVSYGVVPPVATVAGKVMTIGFVYDSIATKWGCVAYCHI